jgi:Membrane protein involved in the export of O-antigen and teichoic acid
MDRYKKFAQRVGLVGLTNLIISLSNIILLPILTKNLPIEEYGIWNQLMITVGIVPSAVLLGLPNTMNRFIPSLKTREETQETFYSIFSVIIVLSVIISILIYIFSKEIANSLFGNNVQVVKVLSIVVFIECLLNLFINYFMATQQIKKYSLLLSMQTLLNIIFVSFYVRRGEGVYGALLGFTIRGVLILFIMFMIITSDIGFKVPTFLKFKDYLKFGLPTVPGSLSTWIVNSSDRYVINFLLGATFVGLYSPGYVLGNTITMFLAPITFILPPTISRYYDEGNLGEVRTMLSYSMKYFMLIAIPSAFGLSLLSKSLLTILSTTEIASEGYLITPFTAISSIFFGMYAIIAQVCIMEKKTKIIGKIWTIAALINLILNFILVPKIGILGAAITTLIAFVFSFISSQHYCSKLFNFDMNGGFIVKSIFASFLMSLVIIVMKPESIYNIVFTIGICAIVYSTVILLLKGIEKREIRYLKSFIS